MEGCARAHYFPLSTPTCVVCSNEIQTRQGGRVGRRRIRLLFPHLKSTIDPISSICYKEFYRHDCPCIVTLRRKRVHRRYWVGSKRGNPCNVDGTGSGLVSLELNLENPTNPPSFGGNCRGCVGGPGRGAMDQA